MISSSKSGSSLPSVTSRPRKLATFRENRKLAWVGMAEGGFVIP